MRPPSFDAKRLVEWIKESPENERVFWSSMFTRLLPTHLHGSGEHGEIELNAKIKPEEIAHRLMELGLPLSLFDNIDVPTLDEGNGADLDAEQSNDNDAATIGKSTAADCFVPPEGSLKH